MAAPSTVHKARIQLSDVDRGVYDTLQVTVARHPSETAERLVGRLLAYALLYREDLAFTKGICDGEAPDLWVQQPDGTISLWLEVGLPPAKRLLGATRRERQVVLLAFGSARHHWDGNELPQLQGQKGIAVTALDWDFVQALAATLERSIDWNLTVSDGLIYLDSGGSDLSTPIHTLSGEPLTAI